MIQNLGNRLLEAVFRQSQRVQNICIAENLSSNQKVHELRRSFKQLRALLFLFVEIPESLALQLTENIRNYGKRLAHLRESAVNLELLEKEITAGVTLPEMKIMAARELFAEKNKTLVKEGFENNNLGNEIRIFFETFDGLLTNSTKVLPGPAEVCREIYRSYIFAYYLYTQMMADPHPDEWHNLRKKLKRLWYQFDFTRFLEPRYLDLKSAQLNTITDKLGDDHDMHIFTEELLHENYGFDAGELLAINNSAENYRIRNQKELHFLLKQFFDSLPEVFARNLERIFEVKFRND